MRARGNTRAEIVDHQCQVRFEAAACVAQQVIHAVLRVNQLREQRIRIRLEQVFFFFGDIAAGGVVAIIPELHQVVERSGNEMVLRARWREKLDVEVDAPVQLVLDQTYDGFEQHRGIAGIDDVDLQRADIGVMAEVPPHLVGELSGRNG